MATATELFGRRHGGDRHERSYKVVTSSVETDTDAQTAILALAPATYDDLERDTDSLEIEEAGQDLAGNVTWLGRISYRVPGVTTVSTPLQVGESARFSFDTSGGTVHIKQSRELIANYDQYGSLGLDKLFQGAIGVTADSVEGVDIVVPVFNFEMTKVLSAATVTTSYIQTVFSLTGKTNSDSFQGFDAGSVLFLGASGTTRDDGDWEITYRFAASPNVTGLTIGDITGVAKKGWQYLWVRYRHEERTSPDPVLIATVPDFVMVERVYDEGAFSGLGI